MQYFLNKNGLLGALLVVIFLGVLGPTLGTGYTTRDDMNNAVNHFDTYVTLAQQQGRLQFITLHGLWAMGIHQLGNHHVVKVINLAIMAICLVMAMLLVRALLPQGPWAWLYGFLYLLGLKDNWEHMVYTSSPGLYNLPMAFYLFSLVAFHQGLAKDKKTWLWISAFAYLVSLQFSEMFLPLALVFLLILWLQKPKWGALLPSLWPHALLAILFMGAYFAWRHGHPSQYDGNVVVGFWSSIPKIIKTDLIYSFSVFPLANYPDIHNSEIYRTIMGATGPGVAWRPFPLSIFQAVKKIATHGYFWSPVLVFLLAMAAALPWILFTKKIWAGVQSIGLKKFLALLFIFAAMSLGPNLPHALTEKYRDWALVNHLTVYVGSYLSYFGVIGLTLLFWQMAMGLLRPKPWGRWLFSGALSVFLVLCVLVAQPITNAVIKTKVYSHTRWVALDQFLKSAAFKKIPPHSQIYLQGFDENTVLDASAYPGYWGQYIHWKTKKHLAVSTDPTEIMALVKKDPEALIHWVRLDLVPGKPEGLLVYSPTRKILYGARHGVVHLDAIANELLLFPVGGKGFEVLLPDSRGQMALTKMAPSSIESKLALPGVSLSQVFAKRATGSAVAGQMPLAGVSSPIGVQVGEGFFDAERGGDGSSWNWAGPKAVLHLRNDGARPVRVRVNALLVKGFLGLGPITISGPGVNEHLEIIETGTPWFVDVTLAPGENSLRFQAQSQKKDPAITDPRPIHFGLFSLEIGAPPSSAPTLSIQ